MFREKFNDIQLHPGRFLVIGFFSVILMGGLLLSTPFVTQSGRAVPMIDAFFMATTSVCVTGLVTVDTSATWNLLGQIIIMILIQIGGLGVMTTATIGTFIVGKKITLRNRMIIKESMSEYSVSGVVRMTRKIIQATFLIEFLGACILSFTFVPVYGWSKGLWFSLFHAISSFCNAGIDLIGPYSIKPFATEAPLTLTIAALIILGGIGFSVILDVMHKLHKDPLSLHTKLVLTVTASLIGFGMLFFLISEYNNPLTLGPMAFGDKLENAFFQAVTPRTAGYATINQWEMTRHSQIITQILMFIGGSPGSTAGGIKTVSFGLIIATVYSVIKGRYDTEIYGRRISKDTVNRAYTVLVIGLSVVFIPLMLLVLLNPELDPFKIMFETISAFGTVGLTAGITPQFSQFSKVILMVTMFFGRVGPLTILMAIAERAHDRNLIRYPEGRVNLG